MTAEHDRLEEAREQQIRGKEWGTYGSERPWGTVGKDPILKERLFSLTNAGRNHGADVGRVVR
jgi:hypothetical protein